MGRPKIQEKRNKELKIFLTESEKQRIKNISGTFGLSPATYARMILSKSKIEVTENGITA